MLTRITFSPLTDEDGEKFWSKNRKMPVALEFDPQDPLHVDFLVAATALKGWVSNVINESMYG